MDNPYSNRELDAKFGFLEEQANDHFEATTKVLASLVDQVTKANGRTRALEGWRQFTLGAIAVLTVVVLPSLGWLMLNSLATSNKVSAIAAVVHTLTN